MFIAALFIIARTGKQRTPLSFRVATGTSWSPLCGLKGVKPPVKFGEKTRDCSPGQAGKEVPNLYSSCRQSFPTEVSEKS